MSLEEKTKDFMLEGEFNRENFVKTGKIYQDMGKWVQTLQKDGNNVEVYRKAGKTLQKNPNFYYQSGTNPRPRLEDTLSVLQENRAQYAKEKYSNIVEGFNDEHWMSLISSLPLYKTENKEHDEIIDVLNQKKQMDEIVDNPEKMINFLSKKSQKFDMIIREEFEREIHNQRYLKTLFGLYQRENNIKYAKAFYNEKGEMKEGLAKSIFEGSLRAAESKMEKETNEGDKSDIWEADVRPYYLYLDEVKYKLEKNKLEEEEREKNKR